MIYAFQTGMSGCNVTHGYLEVIHLSIHHYISVLITVTQHSLQRREEKRSCEHIDIIDIIGPRFVWGDREITEGDI